MVDFISMTFWTKRNIFFPSTITVLYVLQKDVYTI
jgi:hypothetical protein